MKLKPQQLIFTLMLGSVCLLPLANDIFISGFPVMSSYFHTNRIGLVLTVFLLGLAIVQPFYGPLSDRFGRRPVFLTGMWIYTLASGILVFTSSWPIFLVARFVQAVGACSIIVSLLAVLRDTYAEDRLISATALLFGIIGVCPVIAPLIGGLLNTAWGWRASFALLFGLAIFYTLILQYLL